MKVSKKILVLFAHPAIHKSRINKRLAGEIRTLEGVHFHDLYDAYPDYHVHVKKEQKLLLQNDVIVWQHPFYWYSAPAILKEWIDLVLEHSWAYGHEGNMLKGKQVFSAISTGGGWKAYAEGGYNGFTINQFLLPFRQTAALCKMTYLAPFVVPGTHLLREKDIENYALKYKQLLISIRDGIYDEKKLLDLQYLNELID
jgi:glutathione-regulated potassium-efflux system ancillary protein KefG